MDPLIESGDSAPRGDDTETDPDRRIGQLVDERYTILAAMASGSMGAVYKAERVPVGKLVAIKFLHASYAKDAEFLGRFERETRVMSKLAHPNCVSVVDFGVWEGAPYLVMEYVAGTTLRSLIDEGQLPPARALLLTRQIAAGLAHAHAQGVVHRDVKPANIMISQEVGTGDHVRILDFGLARLRGNVGRDATQANVVVGTPNYMAPEQTVGGGTIDARTDIYAVGVVLFEMCAGVRPFSADDTMALLGMHRAAPIPKLADKMEEAVPIPDGLQEIIEKAMAKSPDDRFQTAIELTEAIDELVGPRLTGKEELSRPHAKVDPAAVASTLLDVRSTKVARPTADEPPPTKRKRSSAGSLGFLAVVLAGAATAAWYIKMRPSSSDAPADAAPMIATPPLAIDASAIAPVDAAEVPLASDATITVTVDGAAQDGSGGGSGGGEIEMDPESATNPDPNADTQTAEDEAPDAPETPEDAEKRAPPEPVLAQTVPQAIQLIKDGKRDLAIASLRALWKQSPNSAYLPFLLGNLYNDRLWWSVAMDHYKAAITKNGKYRGNAVLNRNVIRMLASPKTVKKATGFLRSTIGRSAVPYLRIAAKNEPNERVRKQAAALAKSIR
ncbi:MAG: protein kinase [Myxococcales bacterium]|nr:protein kinase [Myxococcales bacterium]